MKSRDSATEVLAVMDGATERPIPTVWRPVFKEIVNAFVAHDYGLSAGVPEVEAVSLATATHIRNYIQNYGATLLELPEEAWESSVCIWMGNHWDALVDLWTQAEGRSDLVLSARVMEAGSGFAFKVHMVYVP
jgi:hypothetical protein